VTERDPERKGKRREKGRTSQR